MPIDLLVLPGLLTNVSPPGCRLLRDFDVADATRDGIASEQIQLARASIVL